MRHGVVGVPLSTEERRRRIEAVVLAESKGFRWYSRSKLWDYANQFQLDGIIDLDNTQYMTAFSYIDHHYRCNARVRESLQLLPHVGPQTSEDRGSAQEEYLGNVRFFKYFHRGIFDRQLQILAPTASIDSVSERAFMGALRNTSSYLANWNILRGVTTVDCFCGPQSFVHRTDAARMQHRMSVDSHPPIRSIVHYTAETLQCMQCDACAKWRRVDAATLHVFDTATWERETLRRIESEVLHAHPDFRKLVRTLAESFKHAGTSVRLTPHFLDFHARLIGHTVEPSALSLDESVFLRLFVEEILTVQDVTIDEHLFQHYTTSLSNLQSVRFTCEALVDTSCNLPCDWTTAFAQSHDLSMCATTKEPALLLPSKPVRHTDMPYRINILQHQCAEVSESCRPPEKSRCRVRDCDKALPGVNGQTYTIKVGKRVVGKVHSLCNCYYQRLTRHKPQTLTEAMEFLDVITNPSSEPTVSSHAQHSHYDTCTFQVAVTFQTNDTIPTDLMFRYSRQKHDVAWTLFSGHRNQSAALADVRIVPEALMVIRTAKIHAAFNKSHLQRILQMYRILDSMVLFRCLVCNNRFPTFHPDFKPPLSLQCLTYCSIDVRDEDWDTRPAAISQSGDSGMASFHTGTCKRCYDASERDSTDSFLATVPCFSARNHMDFLHGMSETNALPCEQQLLRQTTDVPPLLGEDVDRIRAEYVYLFKHATVVECMLVSLNHMQVSVCHMRQRRFRSGDMLSFHKNVICFPQVVTELENLQAFWRNLRCYDIVNVCHGDGPVPRKAMVESIDAKTVSVRFEDDGSSARIDPLSVRQRFRLPWQPKDLHDYLIVFRRQIPNRPGEYIEDLRVRRNLVARLLRLFTRQGTWREHCGIQTMHQYYILQIHICSRIRGAFSRRWCT